MRKYQGEQLVSKEKKEVVDNELCEGVMLSESFFEGKENRLYTLLLKGFIVYLLTMGSIGFYLSAFKIEYNVIFCHIVILVVAVLCALLYYRLLIENLGYLALFAIFGALVYNFKIYINSGFYAIVNITTNEASEYLDVDIKKLYNEQIENRYVTVTFVALFIGIVLDILLNVYISRRMQYVTAIVITISFNLIPLYLTCEPDIIYVIMLFAGIAMSFVLKAGKHYSPQMNVRRNNDSFEFKGRKRKKNKEISYVYDIKALLRASVYALLFALILPSVVSTIKPKENFNSGYTGNKYKQQTMEMMTTVLLEGFRGLWEENNSGNGGLMSGELGSVSSIRLDNETDVVLEFTPYSYDTVYLKFFVGNRYNSYGNYWSIDEENYDSSSFNNTIESEKYKEAYYESRTNSAKGKMTVICMDTPSNACQTYYTGEISEVRGNHSTLIYYPALAGNTVNISASDYGDKQPYSEADLMVPNANVESVKKFVEKLGYLGTEEEIIQTVKDYFADNFPYTINPGKTPRNKDFVNDFLDNKQRGYCAHFASAATLIFRYLGIPARYVEGYAVSYNDITLNGELNEDLKYEDYYDGYSVIGQTACVTVNATDANAHAWVEVYLEGKGWCVVDVTPASGEEEEAEDFWTMFGDRQDTDDGDVVSGLLSGGNFQVSDKLIKTICMAVAGIIGAVILVIFGIKITVKIIFLIRYAKAGINDKLIIRYVSFKKKKTRRNKELRTLHNYGEQVNYFMEKYKETACDGQKIIAILEKAGFSNRAITEGEFDEVIMWMKKCKG